MVSFQQGSMVLDGLSRQKVAERVRLRGRVASTQLSEDMKKLAVGRAYAVKVEFGKHDVDKAKIRILNPQQATAESATGTVRGVDVMLDMPLLDLMRNSYGLGASWREIALPSGLNA